MKRVLSVLVILAALIGPAQADSDDITRALQTLRPGAAWSIAGTNCGDLKWLDAVQVKPTCAEIAAAISSLPAKDPALDNFDVLTLRIVFNHENRIRALEGKQAITMQQFKTALKALLP